MSKALSETLGIAVLVRNKRLEKITFANGTVVQGEL